MAALNEFDTAVLTTDLPDHGLRAGDMGSVVHIHGKGEGYEIEFFTLTGDTIDVVTVNASQVRAVTEHDVAHARRRAG